MATSYLFEQIEKTNFSKLLARVANIPKHAMNILISVIKGY